jgi:hypothetical protein
MTTEPRIYLWQHDGEQITGTLADYAAAWDYANTTLDHTLDSVLLASDGRRTVEIVPISGNTIGQVWYELRAWGEVAKASVLVAKPLTPADVKAHPEFFISGPGRVRAAETSCNHGYRLTDSCPACP